MSDSEFLPVWKKYPGVAGTMIKAGKSHDAARDRCARGGLGYAPLD
ncbi:MAG: hypothetical protein V2B19_18875 [Pseudomonadota bacterium]